MPSPRGPNRHAHHHRTFPRYTTLWERFCAVVLPLDFSRTTTRFVFHLVSIRSLSKMLIIWTVLVLQTCQVPLVFGGDQKGPYVDAIQGYLEKLARWAVDKEMTEICWSTFCAVCGAFLIEGFIKALDGLGGGGGFPHGGGVHSLSPFHLVSRGPGYKALLMCFRTLQVSYAFLLHVYSSPVTHGFRPADGSPSRPDKHVVITITIALLQVGHRPPRPFIGDYPLTLFDCSLLSFPFSISYPSPNNCRDID
jgi:hypothetical protein